MVLFFFLFVDAVAQPLVGAAYQDSLREQEGPKAIPCIWRDKEGATDQQARHETGQNSPPYAYWTATMCWALLRVFHI